MHLHMPLLASSVHYLYNALRNIIIIIIIICYEFEQVKASKKISDLKKDKSIEAIQLSLQQLNKTVVTLLARAQQSQKTLDQIAIPHSEVQYIDQLIESEKLHAKPGFERAMKSLRSRLVVC